MSTSTLLPRDVVKKGRIGNGVWLQGLVVSVRSRKPNQPQAPTTGKGKGKSKSTKAPSEGLEVHITGGKTPGDVMVLEAWETAARDMLLRYSPKGKSFRVTEIESKEHTDKTAPWTTSRLRFYCVLNAASKIETVEASPDWLGYHPLTMVPSMQRLPDGKLVCIAGRVLLLGPKNEA